MARPDRGYWQSAVDDEAMQDAHEFVWEAMLESIGMDLSGLRVLDIGCNRGGLLRLLSDRAAIAQGCGYDPAPGAIADARVLTGGWPLRFEVADSVPRGWEDFDVAFGHEVLYLVHDLHAHAAMVFKALAPRGVYFAVMGMHRASPVVTAWHRQHQQELELPPLYDLEEVVGAFTGAGFETAASRLRIGFAAAYSGIGFVEGIIVVSTPALMRDFSPQMDRGAAMGFWALGPTLGSVTASLVATRTLPHLHAWQHQFVISGLVCMGAVAISLLFLRELSPKLRDQLMVSERERALVEARARGIDVQKATAHPLRSMMRLDLISSSVAVSVFLLYLLRLGERAHHLLGRRLRPDGL